MEISVVGTEETGWELVIDDIEPACVAEKMSYLEAIDCFAANAPQFMPQLDKLRQDYIDFVGEPVKPARQQRSNTTGPKREKKQGSGARFRELILANKSNEECLRIVRAEFPDSKATLSDAAWNRTQLRKNPSGFGPDGRKI